MADGVGKKLNIQELIESEDFPFNAKVLSMLAFL